MVRSARRSSGGEADGGVADLARAGADREGGDAGLVVGHHAVGEGEEGPIATDAHVLAGMQLAAALADEDVAGQDGLPAELLYAEALGLALAAVGG